MKTCVLEELVDAKSGFASGENVIDGIIQIRMNNVTSEGHLDWSRIRRVPAPKKGIGGLLAEPGDVLFNATNSPELVGKSAYYFGSDEPVTFSNHFLRLRPREELDGRYLAFWLTSQWSARKFEGMCRAWVNQASVSKDQLLALEIPLPPLAEQQRIAAILDQADAIRRSRRTALFNLGRLEQALFIQMFGDPVVNPRGIPLVAFESLIAEGPTNGLYKPASDYGDGTPILRIGDFYDGRVPHPDNLRRLRVTEKELAAFALQKDDIVINRVNSREYLGKSTLIPNLSEGAVFESNMMRIRLDRTQIEPQYCISFLQLPFVKRQILQKTKDAINQSSINQKDVRSFIVMLPAKFEQQRFSQKVREIEKLVAQQSSNAACLDSLFASLQHRAFRGEL